MILAATDLESCTLPDEATFSTLGCGLLLAALRDRATRDPDRGFASSLAASHLLEALLGAILGAVFLEGVRRAYAKLRGQEGMGAGDVKMLAMAGAFTGPAGVFFTLFFASLAGTAVAGGATLARALRWSLEARRARRSSSEARSVAARAGLLVGEDGRLLSASARFREIPGAAAEGDVLHGGSPRGGPSSRVRAAGRARARRGARTASGRIALDDGADFFRVLAARAEATPGGLLFRSHAPTSRSACFSRAGALGAFVAGRSLWEALATGVPWIPRLLP